MALQTFIGPWPLLQFRNHFFTNVGLLGRVISRSQGRNLHAGQNKRSINAHRYPSLTGMEPTIPPFQRAKTVHALDRTVTVIG
jgi:hypothetical protein